MSELMDAVKGLSPVFFSLAVLGICIKVRERRFNAADKIVLAVLLIFIAGVVGQPLIFYGKLAVSRRYMLIAVPLFLAWSAEGVLWIWEKVRKFRYINITLALSFAALAVLLLYVIYVPVVIRRTSPKKSFERRAAYEAAEFIRNDYSGEKRCEFLKPDKCDLYFTGRRPLVQSDIEQLGYLCGGSAYLPYFETLGLKPDYIAVKRDVQEIPGYELVRQYRGKKRILLLWKRKDAAARL